MVLVVVIYAAHEQLDASLRTNATARAGQAASEVAGLFSRSTLQAIEVMRGASPCLSTFVLEPTPQHRDAAVKCLRALNPTSQRRVAVWNSAGERMLVLPEEPLGGTGDKATLDAPLTAPPAGVSPMHADREHDRAVATVAAPISVMTATGPGVIGRVATLSVLAVTPRDVLQQLVGSDAHLFFGNQQGDVWTDTTRLVEPPSNDASMFGATHPLAGTPWVVHVALPSRLMTDEANAHLREIVSLGLVIWLGSVAVARWFAFRIAAPIGKMTIAAEALAGGDYSVRVNASGTDEIGRLGGAFDAMTARLKEAHHDLEQRVEQRTEDLNKALAALSERGQDRESYLATIVDGSADAIVGKDLTGMVTSWNKSAERIFGYTAEEMIGTSMLRVIPPERHHEEATILESVRRGESVERFQTVRLHKSGRRFDVALTVSPIKDATGRIVGVSKVARDVTDQKRAEDQLREREEQLRLYAQHNPVAVAMFDRQMQYLVASDSWLEAFQLHGTPLAGRSHYEIFPDLPPRWREIHQRCLAGAVEKCDEDPFTREDGRTTWLRWEVRPWRQADGAIGGIIIFAEDITARKANAELLRTVEGRYQTLFNCAPDGILIVDGSGKCADANPSLCRMLGYEREQLLGRPSSDLVVPEEAPHIEPALQALGQRHQVHREWQLLRKDGSMLVADIITTAMPDGRHISMVRDVTERNQATEALRIAEERMRFALASAGIGIWDLDYQTGAVSWSEILEAQNGLAPGTFSGTLDDAVSYVHPEDRTLVRVALADAALSGRDFSMRYRVIRRDGAVRNIEGAGRVLLGPAGEPLRGVGISIDVTERHTLEAQYQQAQKMEAVGRLAGGIAHDFNNLLTVILGHCELMLYGETMDSRVRHSAAGIEKAARQAAGLTRQLLAFSRKQIVEPKLLDLSAIVHDLQPMLTRLIGEDIEVAIELLGGGESLVKADKGQVEQVVMNLAVNARDAMPHGGVLTIETSLVELDEQYAKTHLDARPGPYVVLTVSDTGIGMSAEIQARLFEPFFTTKEVGKGTGLGLATVHGIVSSYGGSVGVYSEIGRGTSFKVYFPRVVSQGAVAEPAAAPVAAHGGHETVLVVEDSELLRGVTVQLLEKRGYTVLAAAGAEEAKRMFDEHADVDVVLTDVVMPGASGPQLTEELRQRRANLKVIYMSGYTEEAIVHHGVLNPNVAFIHKPFTSDTLAQKIREVLDRG